MTRKPNKKASPVVKKSTTKLNPVLTKKSPTPEWVVDLQKRFKLEPDKIISTENSSAPKAEQQPSGVFWQSIEEVKVLTTQLSVVNSINESLLDRVFGEHAPSASDLATKTNNNSSTVGPAKSKMAQVLEELQLEINRAMNISSKLKTIA